MSKVIRGRATHAALLVVAVSAAGLAFPATAAAAGCATGEWTAKYYANTSFSGTPKKTVCDKAISENYGTGDPAGVTLPKNNFGVRWSVTRDFGSGGPFSFKASAQDGIRVYLDGTRKINIWGDVSSTRSKTVNVTIPKGKHTIRVDFAAFTGKADVAFSYAPRTSSSVDKVKPLGPTGLAATYDAGTSKTALSWKKNAELDLAGYRVYRSGKLVSGSAPLTKPAFTDSTPATGSTYGYTVKAVDKAGNVSAASATVNITSVDRTAPAVPSGVVVTYSEFGGYSTVKWNAVAASDLAGYEVYYRQSDGDAWTEVGGSTPVTGTSLTDFGGTGSFTYAVVAVDKAGNASAHSATAVASPQIPLLTPIGLKATKTAAGVQLTWTANPVRGTSYNVYRTNENPTQTTRWTKLGTVSGPAPSFTDTAPVTGEPNTYVVTATDGVGNEGEASGFVTVVPE
ncbi:fibronectin type III domain-containing protein [Streptomyces ipomoeae]|uniref:Putative cellulose 1,4-beta-cellobiosidase n=1 Tax=Streptomyces ipomoeae 91-03 TaxID=698759 RepID=L1L279_9ACTN|nr:PA14 domain-containing protein [Streptomyces ipomoeae]EKX66904.1 putative cellulose 1,4-beta-cellobiosidase [Streptomyces ipomoeae 91-03]MDX2699455.1 PA14 domain-containing protein [Streptomyces ipomoeae]MDX2842987.1 PA14 domain-containing protein [Streptomyces ipomoeae]TQE34025.1 cellulose 1,4-beta-cellobiosidase [Streptomyces ipomoeae]